MVLAEDALLLPERATREDGFLEMAYDIFHERPEMFLDSLQRVRRGPVEYVFDTLDRIARIPSRASFWLRVVVLPRDVLFARLLRVQ